MTTAIKKQLDKNLRDALLALYLNKVAPAAPMTKTLKSARDLYEYWLLDVLVTQDVPTTPVSCGIASLQQYINRILMNMEPGYDSANMTPERLQTWRNELHQYPVWAAHQKLLYFPSIYLHPHLRNNKSDNFQTLENELSQNRIKPDAVQAAVLSYLTRFEEVANLNILNGYIDGTDFANSTYYFIAKSRSDQTYFWRSLNMAQRPSKRDQPDPYAWSDWEKADVPISDDAIEHSIRPVWFNNRLFVVWAECLHQDSAVHSQQNQANRNNLLFRLNLSYRKHDGRWSTARSCLQGYSDDNSLDDMDLDSIKSMTGTVAIVDQENSEELFIALYVNQRNKAIDQFVFLRTANIDKNLIHTPGASSLDKGMKNSQEHPHYTLTKHFSTSLNKGSLQLKTSKEAKDAALERAKIAELDKSKYANNYPLDDIFYIETSHTQETNQLTISLGTTLSPKQNIASHYIIIRPESEHPSERSLEPETLPKATVFKYHTIGFNEDGETFHCGVHATSEGVKRYWLASIKLSIGNDFRTPYIGCNGTAQFLKFSMPKTSYPVDEPEEIRLNTVFAAEMIRRTENSLDELFSLNTQHLAEPRTADTRSESAMNFHGAYGRYFTELFLYLPWLVAHRLNSEHQYDEAERWMRYVFDPCNKKGNYWNAQPLIGPDVLSYSNKAPHDPHQIALSYPVHFRKALYFLYLDILINRGDAAYRKLTPDSLGEAKLWYMRALDLLGPRPIVQWVDQWSAVSLQTLSEKRSENLREFENAASRSNTTGLQIRESNSQASLPAIDTPSLHLPFNPELLKRWDIVESRLYNLRHNLDIAGKPLHLPLFAAPLDPRGLLSANVSSALNGTTSQLPNMQIPPYRFTVMHSLALSAVESVSQFGATLLSLIERKEQVQLQDLQQQQAWNLAKISVDLQTQALRIDHQNRQALLASKAIVQGRVFHYQQLLEKDITETETLAGQLYLSSGAYEVAASAAQVIAGGLMTAPNIFGLSNGGMRWEGMAHAATALAQGSAIGARTSALNLDRTAQFSRRREEWTLTRDQAQLELVQIDAQLAHFAEQETASRLQLRLAETALSHAKANYEFLGKRFTKVQLYQWLNSQFATLYHQAYDATLALCLAAETCWQYERADFTTRFVQPGTWNTTYRGLGAGEQLKLSLLKMQTDYMQSNERELEIRKTVSLRQIKEKDKDNSVNKTWPEIQTGLKNGACDFELTHAMFEADYKDQKHYLRRIKTISVSLPALLGPYENVRATLTQITSKVFMSAGDEGPTMENKRANQQIALSTGVDDNGLFTLNFNDERYLPFEYTGAISTWRLTFPNPTAQKAMLESLTDIIVHVNYTARVDGGSQ
jgi:hypothetical protein